jgi:glycosyltransferase involved in cell wall biosynthesis
MSIDQSKIEIVPNGIDMSKYENLPDKGIFRSKYGIQSNEKIVLYLGRIHRIKGIDVLIEAFSELIDKIERVRLVIVGPDDGFLPTLKAKIEELNIGQRIIFTGPLYGRDKLEAYVDANVYVLPSFYETFPVTVLEACACGTPVIVTDRCGISDIVSKIGYVVKYDKEQLKEAIIVSLSDTGLRSRFEQESKNLIKEQFAWNTIVENFEEIYSRSANDSM